MQASRIVADILEQDERRTRRADQLHFFQMLRAARERTDPPPAAAPRQRPRGEGSSGPG